MRTDPRWTFADRPRCLVFCSPPATCGHSRGIPSIARNRTPKALTRNWRQQLAAVGSRKCSCGEAAVAIKRPSKSLGTPVRKPVTSPGLRHVDVRVPHQMVPGDPYVGWVCKNKSCGLVIAIALTQAGSKPASAEFDQLAAIKCPHCGDEDLYRWSARSEHKYTVGSA
jgi:hypothetical protein